MHRMAESQYKYSIWLRTSGTASTILQSLILQLASEYGAPIFEPHLTIVGSVYSSEVDLDHIQRPIDELASHTFQFPVTLSDYRYTNETYRSLYLTAHSSRLTPMYKRAASLFPHVHSEHFAAQPHISILYGQYDEEIKKAIIAAHPILPLQFEATTLDLVYSHGPVSSWRIIYSRRLSS